MSIELEAVERIVVSKAANRSAVSIGTQVTTGDWVSVAGAVSPNSTVGTVANITAWLTWQQHLEQAARVLQAACKGWAARYIAFHKETLLHADLRVRLTRWGGELAGAGARVAGPEIWPKSGEQPSGEPRTGGAGPKSLKTMAQRSL